MAVGQGLLRAAAQPQGGAGDSGKQRRGKPRLGAPSAQAVGFDMDYTLAQYKPESFEGLAHVQVQCLACV